MAEHMCGDEGLSISKRRRVHFPYAEPEPHDNDRDDNEYGPDCVVGHHCVIRDSKFGTRVRVWSFVNIYDSTIGDDCRIGSYCEIGGSKLGKGCVVQARVFLPPGTVVGDRVFIGPGVIVCNEKRPRARKPGEKWHMEAVEIGPDARIGAGAIILPGVKIGASATVGAGAVVTKDVDACAVVVGNPAAPLRRTERRRVSTKKSKSKSR